MLRALRVHLPCQCEVCRRWSAGALCADCVARFAAPTPRCQRCALRLSQAAAMCGACLRRAPPFERTVCAVDYDFPWDRLVTRFKFNQQPELAAPLAALLTIALRAEPGREPQLVLPVPLGPLRLKDRGYNQAWELARRVAGDLSLPARTGVLQRAVETSQQADLSRAQRQGNLRAAFFVASADERLLRGRRVALVDDVMTTGATAREAAKELLRAGAAAVDLWVLARTPEN